MSPAVRRPAGRRTSASRSASRASAGGAGAAEAASPDRPTASEAASPDRSADRHRLDRGWRRPTGHPARHDDLVEGRRRVERDLDARRPAVLDLDLHGGGVVADRGGAERVPAGRHADDLEPAVGVRCGAERCPLQDHVGARERVACRGVVDGSGDRARGGEVGRDEEREREGQEKAEGAGRHGGAGRCGTQAVGHGTEVTVAPPALVPRARRPAPVPGSGGAAPYAAPSPSVCASARAPSTGSAPLCETVQSGRCRPRAAASDVR